MTLNVSDVRSNGPEQIQHAAQSLGRSPQRIAVFEAIYKGGSTPKSVKILANLCLAEIKDGNHREIRIAQEAAYLFNHGMVEKYVDEKTHKLCYKKVDFYKSHKKQIVEFARDPKKMKKMISKRTPIVREVKSRTVVYKSPINAKQISIDDIDNFLKVKKTGGSSASAKTILEKNIKNGFKKIIGETGKFTDWGGERNDLFTTRVRLDKKRISAAIAFKGRATHGILTPKKLGKNGDQINRLFTSPAQLFLVVYHSEIDQSVLEQMKAFAVAVGQAGQKIYYGIVDGKDLNAIITAYPNFFK